MVSGTPRTHTSRCVWTVECVKGTKFDRARTPATRAGYGVAAPDTRGTYLGNRERAAIYRYATRHAAEFTTAPDEADDFESWLCAVKLARILLEWTGGADPEALVDQYRIGPGDLESHVERTAGLLGAADALSDTLDAGVSVFGAVREELPSADAEADRRRP